jgi:hypothetical protein
MGEDKWFRDWIQTNQPQWTEAVRLPWDASVTWIGSGTLMPVRASAAPAPVPPPFERPLHAEIAIERTCENNVIYE